MTMRMISTTLAALVANAGEIYEHASISHTHLSTRISNRRKTSVGILMPWSEALPMPEAPDCNVPVDQSNFALDQSSLL